MKEKKMQVENADNKLSYQGDQADGASIYHMLLAGRVVMVLKVNVAEENMPIYVRKADEHVDSLLGFEKTALRAFPVEDKSRVSAMSMKEAVYGNLPFLLADLIYGPVQK